MELPFGISLLSCLDRSGCNDGQPLDDVDLLLIGKLLVGMFSQRIGPALSVIGWLDHREA